MIPSDLLIDLAAERAAGLRGAADRARLLATVRPRRRRVRLRRRGVTVEIHLSADLRPGQVDEIFASLARHLGAT